MFRFSRNLSRSILSAAITTLLVMGLFGDGGCGRFSTPKPSNAKIEEAIMKTGARNPLVGRVELETVQIQQIGSLTQRKSIGRCAQK